MPAINHVRGNLAIEFSVYKHVMWCVGAWPLDSKCFLNVRWFIGMFAECGVAFSAILDVVKPRSEYGSTLDNLYILQICLLSFLKNLLFRLRSAKLQNNVTEASKDWSQPRAKESFILMKKRARISRIISAALSVSGYICFTTFFISTVIYPWTSSRTSEKLVRNYLLPFGPLEDIGEVEHRWLLLLQFFLSCVVHARQCVIDSFFFSSTMHLCAQFDILRLEFHNFHGKYFGDVQYRLELGFLIRRHCQLIDLAKNVEYTFNPIILVQVAISIFLLGRSGLQMVTALKKGAFYDAGQCVPFIIFLVLQIVIYAHAGQTLFEESRNILQSVYDTEWQGLRSGRTKDLVLIMMRSNVPFYISGGKFFYMSYIAVFGMIKRVFTYVSFLQITYDYQIPSKSIAPVVR